MDKINKRQSIINILLESEIFSVLDGDELHKLSLLFSEVQIKKGNYVRSEHDEGKTLYVVASGNLMLELMGKPYKVYSIGDVFGEVSFINEHIRTGSIKAISEATLLYIKRKDLFNSRKNDCSTILKIFQGIAKQVTTYLRTDKYTTTQLLILQGESNTVEFKSTLRHNCHTNKNDKGIEHASLKTIAAFLNSKGGTLIIGVDDDGKVIGTEKDSFANDDKALLHFTSLVRKRLNTIHMSSIYASFETIEGKKVMRVDVEPANSPAFLKYKNEELLFIRSGPSTSSLRVSHVYNFIKSRFKDI